MFTTQGLDQLRDSITRTAQVAPQVARREVKRQGRAYFRGAVVAAVITSVLVGVPLALLASQLSGHEKAVRCAPPSSSRKRRAFRSSRRVLTISASRPTSS
ncbi:MAG: hypothetical protein ACRDQX_12465 [Pseudonocardiaceae bacterium]